MKKKLFFVAVVAIVGALAFNGITKSNKTAVSAVSLANIEALTRSEMCPNGCYLCGDGCYCNGSYYNYEEAGSN